MGMVCIGRGINSFNFLLQLETVHFWQQECAYLSARLVHVAEIRINVTIIMTFIYVNRSRWMGGIKIFLKLKFAKVSRRQEWNTKERTAVCFGRHESASYAYLTNVSTKDRILPIFIPNVLHV